MIVLGVDIGATTGLCLLEVRARDALWRADETSREPWRAELVLDDLPRVDLFAIEMVAKVYPRARFAAPMATAIARASRLGGELIAIARAHRREIVEVEAGAWRRALCGRHNATDAVIRACVPPQIRDFPQLSNAHVRDAAGCALFAARRWLLEGRAA